MKQKGAEESSTFLSVEVLKWWWAWANWSENCSKLFFVSGNFNWTSVPASRGGRGRSDPIRSVQSRARFNLLLASTLFFLFKLSFLYFASSYSFYFFTSLYIDFNRIWIDFSQTYTQYRCNTVLFYTYTSTSTSTTKRHDTSIMYNTGTPKAFFDKPFPLFYFFLLITIELNKVVSGLIMKVSW